MRVKFVVGEINSSWVIIAFVAIFVPFVLFTPPQYYNDGLRCPKEWWYTLRISMQVAWLVPLLIILNDGSRTWHRKYFIGGFLVGGGWLIIVELVITMVYFFGPYKPSIESVTAYIDSFFYLGLTSGFYSLVAKSFRQALLFGLLCFVGQVVVFVLVFINFISIVRH